jgi:serine/threonine-protein kinase
MTAPDESGETVESQSQARVGTVLNDKWTLEKLLGIGGMGAVYEGRHRNGARAAVKVLHMQLAREAHFRERFLREGYAANKVDHPGAVKVSDDDVIHSGPSDGSAYIVMELLTGESLQDRFNRKSLIAEREFLLVAICVLDVLESAHKNGVIHRDLKPENIFLLDEASADVVAATTSGGPRVKVLDFGLARLIDSAGSTIHGVALGTPSFMSPEQAAGDGRDIDGRADLFSLAATGFRIIAGRRVHEGAQHPVVQIANMATLPAPKIKTVAPHVSTPLARVVDRALQFKREDRHADAAEMRADVQRALAEIDDLAKNPTLSVDIPPVPLPPPPTQASPVPAPAGSATIILTEKDLSPAGDSGPGAPPPSKAPETTVDTVPASIAITPAGADKPSEGTRARPSESPQAIGDRPTLPAAAPAPSPPPVNAEARDAATEGTDDEAPTKRVLSSSPPPAAGEDADSGAREHSASRHSGKPLSAVVTSLLVLGAIGGVGLLVWRGPTLFAQERGPESVAPLDAGFVVTTAVVAPDAAAVNVDDTPDASDDAAVLNADDLGDLDDAGADDDDDAGAAGPAASSSATAMTAPAAKPHAPQRPGKSKPKPKPGGKPKKKPH